jgi:putative thioredoxin
MADSEWVMDVGERDFETAVLERSDQTPVVLDFWAPWCQPCRMLGPALERLAKEYAGKFLLAKIDIDQNPGLAQEFGVSSIPMVMAIVGRKAASYFVGVLPEADLRKFIDSVLPTESDELAREAARLAGSDPAGARARFEQALEANPKNTAARAALADLCAEAGEWDQAAEHARQVGQGEEGWQQAANVLARMEFREAAAALGDAAQCLSAVEKNPSDVQARFNLGIRQAADGDFAGALEALVQVVETDRTFGHEHARPLMVKIFNLLGHQSELSNSYRSRLARALY